MLSPQKRKISFICLEHTESYNLTPNHDVLFAASRQWQSSSETQWQPCRVLCLLEEQKKSAAMVKYEQNFFNQTKIKDCDVRRRLQKRDNYPGWQLPGQAGININFNQLSRLRFFRNPNFLPFKSNSSTVQTFWVTLISSYELSYHSSMKLKNSYLSKHINTFKYRI